MSTPARYAMILGFVVTLLVAIAHWTGGFDSYERRSIDWRFTHVPREHTPMTSEIVHIDIDDSAQKSVGRWPWDRSTLADAVHELHRAGVRTIAFDLLLTEPQAPTYLPGEDEPIDHDAKLAEALGSVPSILGVSLSEVSIDDVWLTERGRAEREAMLAVLEQDIQRGADDVIEQAGLTGRRRAHFRHEQVRYRELAAWRILDAMMHEREGHESPTFETFIARAVPNVAGRAGRFPERRMLELIWDQQQSWRALRRFILPGGPPGSPADLAPIARLSESAAAIGFVNQQQDADGVKRTVETAMQGHRGEAYQFGIAAAMLHRGLTHHDITIRSDSIVIGETVLPLHDEKLWLHWPTAPVDAPPEHRWADVLRQSTDDPPNTGHISIGALVELAEDRRTHERNRQNFSEVTRLVLTYAGIEVDAGPDAVLESEYIEAARDEIDFTLSDDEVDCAAILRTGHVELDGVDDEAFLDHVYNCCLWLELEQSVRRGDRAIPHRTEELREVMAGKLAFIGWTATGALADFVATPLGPYTPGVVVHAVVADMALTGRNVRLAPAWANHLLLILVGIGCTLTAAGLTPIRSAVVALLLLATYAFAIGYFLFAHHAQIFPLIAPLTAGAGSWIACTTLAATLYQRDRLRITRQFRARVSAQLVDYLVEHPDALSVGGQEREVTVLFADLAGFTRITETMGGPATVATINRYMVALTDRLVDLDAYVNKFLGDGLMAFWSAFSVDPDQSAQACRAALKCVEAVESLNDDPEFAEMPRLGLRVGVATGKVVVGDCGAPPALNDYTVIGDAVNLSSRLEGANKAFGSRILIDEHTHVQLAKTSNISGFVTRPLGRVVVVGQSLPVAVYEVLPEDTAREQIELAERAVAAFERGDATACRECWRDYEEQFGSMPLAMLHHEALIEADEGFDGVLHLKAK